MKSELNADEQLIAQKMAEVYAETLENLPNMEHLGIPPEAIKGMAVVMAEEITEAAGRDNQDVDNNRYVYVVLGIRYGMRLAEEIIRHA